MAKTKTSAEDIVKIMGLEKSPTGGGWYKHVHSLVADECETCTSRRGPTKSASFLYLYDPNTEFQWHRFGSALIWTHLGGDAAELSICDEEFVIERHVMSGDIVETPQPIIIAAAKKWQRIRTTRDWSLLSCTYATGFDFGQMQIAETDWHPEDGEPNLRFPASSGG